jgi:DNA-binding NarL/FixJ family response regulator
MPPLLAAKGNTMKSAPDTRANCCSILVVEDHQLLRISIVAWLECRFPGCLVEGVGSGEEALERVRTACPDIVLMDTKLPGVDGLESTYHIKAQASETAVVLLSTHDTPYHRIAAAEAGAAGYVLKRDMDTQLEPTVARLLKSRERSRHCFRP